MMFLCGTADINFDHLVKLVTARIQYKVTNFLGPHKLHGSPSTPVRKEARNNLDDITFSLPFLHLGELTQEKKHKKKQDKTSP